METIKVCPRNCQGPPVNSCPSIFKHPYTPLFIFMVFLSSTSRPPPGLPCTFRYFGRNVCLSSRVTFPPRCASQWTRWQPPGKQSLVLSTPSFPGYGMLAPLVFGKEVVTQPFENPQNTRSLRTAFNFMLAAWLLCLPSIHCSHAEDPGWFH